jgi:hypothetical protein
MDYTDPECFLQDDDLQRIRDFLTARCSSPVQASKTYVSCEVKDEPALRYYVEEVFGSKINSRYVKEGRSILLPNMSKLSRGVHCAVGFFPSDFPFCHYPEFVGYRKKMEDFLGQRSTKQWRDFDRFVALNLLLVSESSMSADPSAETIFVEDVKKDEESENE